jgi:hypothetical protein
VRRRNGDPGLIVAPAPGAVACVVEDPGGHVGDEYDGADIGLPLDPETQPKAR